MSTKLGKSENIWKLRAEIIKPFAGRDRIWANRREIRYRRRGDALRALPLNTQISDKALMVYQTEGPNQEIHKRTKRLVANEPRFEIISFEDDPEVREMLQGLENGVKALYRWMNRGKVPFDWKVTQFQQGDGVGIGKAIHVPGHGASLAPYDLETIGGPEGEGSEVEQEARQKFRKAIEKAAGRGDKAPEKTAYKDVTDKALQAELPPYRLVAPDPLTCYWWEDEDGVAIMVETGKKSLNPLLSVFHDYGLRKDSNQRLYVTQTGADAISAATAPPDSSTGDRDLSTEVGYTEIRTRDEIAILIEHPVIRDRTPGKDEGRGIVLRFPNPFGPYTTGYVIIPGDVTTETDPADQYQSPALAALNAAQPLNTLQTARLSAALAEAFAPPYIDTDEPVPAPASDEDKTPEVEANREITTIQGRIRRVEAPNVGLDNAENRILADIEDSKLQEAIIGEATSDTSGHRLALQITQADLQAVPYQNARKAGITELLKGIVYAIRKQGLPVYIPTLPDSQNTGEGIRVVERTKITPEMADLPWELLVTLGSETAVTKFAKWQALAQREEQGTLGYQTLIEQSDVENPEDEIARVFEGKLLKATMEQAVPDLVMMLKQYTQEQLQQRVAGAPEGDMGSGMPPGTGLAGGGGAPGTRPSDIARTPGVNMPVVQTTAEYGARVPDSAAATV